MNIIEWGGELVPYCLGKRSLSQDSCKFLAFQFSGLRYFYYN